MNWLRVFRRERHEPDERSQKGAEIIELAAESSQAIREAQRVLEARQLQRAVRNTVKAVSR